MRIRINVGSDNMIDIYENQTLALVSVFMALSFSCHVRVLPSTLVLYREKEHSQHTVWGTIWGR
jgi:hypothetical protein